MSETTPPAHVTLPVADLADALGSSPEGLTRLLELAHARGAVRLRPDAPGGPTVSLQGGASSRLGLSRGEDGRWSVVVGPGPDDAARPKFVSWDFAGWIAPDPRARHPWEELDPPPAGQLVGGRPAGAGAGAGRGRPGPPRPPVVLKPGSKPTRARAPE